MRKRSLSRRRFVAESLEQRLFLSTTVITANVADNSISNTGSVAWVGNGSYRVGDNGTNATEQVAILPFLLPVLPAGAAITGATANFNLEQIANASSVQQNLDVYGLSRRSAPTVLAQDYYRGAYGGDTTDATSVQATLATKTTPLGPLTLSASGQAELLNYINAQYAGGAGSGQYVFLRLNHQVEQGTARYWTISSANNTTVANRPTLTITYDITPAAPSNLAAATMGSSSIQLNWQDNSTNETAFVVERSTDGVNFTAAGTVATDVTSFIDTTGLSADSAYQYRVHAVNGSSPSPDTNIVSATTLPTFTRTLWVNSAYAGTTTNGDYATPYKTISSALAAATSGDGIVLRGATYRETVIMKAGTTLMGTPGERAIISGFADIAGWNLVSGNTYSTTLTWRPATLYVGFDPMDVSRSPNDGWWYGATVTQGTGTTTITDPSHLANIPSLVGGAVHAHFASGNAWGSATITAHDTVNGTVTINALTSLATGDYYMVKNTPDLIDRPGEWAVVNNGNGTWTVFFNPISAGDLNSTQARKLGSQQVRANNTSNNSTLRNVEVTGNTGFGINIGNSTSSRATNVTVRDVVVHNNGGTGIQSRYSANITVRNSIVLANGGSGIAMVSTQTGLVDRNQVGFNGIDGVIIAGDISGKSPSDPAFDPSDSITVSNNYIHDHNGFTHPDGIQMYRWPTNSRILNNFIIRSGQGLMTEEVASAEFSGNVVWDTAAYNVIFGHSNSSNWLIKNNTIGGAGYGPYNISGTNFTMYENVYTRRMTIPSLSTGYVGDRNLFWAGGSAPLRLGASTTYSTIASWNAATGQDANSAIGDPQFENAPPVQEVMDSLSTATTTSMQLRSVGGFAIGDKIQINGDGVVRTVTSVNTGTRVITWDVPLPMQPLTPYVTVDNFKTSTNFAIDLRLKPTSAGYTLGATGGPVGSAINTLAYVAGDFDNDGVRDLPLLSGDIAADLPGGNSWVPGSGI